MSNEWFWDVWCNQHQGYHLQHPGGGSDVVSSGEVFGDHLVEILNAAEEINTILPKGLLTCWGEGMVAIPVDAARRLRKAVEGLE
jgi:hypothetical protein